jgi:hypothetical protein
MPLLVVYAVEPFQLAVGLGMLDAAEDMLDSTVSQLLFESADAFLLPFAFIGVELAARATRPNPFTNAATPDPHAKSNTAIASYERASCSLAVDAGFGDAGSGLSG